VRIYNPTTLKDPSLFLFFFEEKTLGSTNYFMGLKGTVCWYVDSTSVECIVVLLLNI